MKSWAIGGRASPKGPTLICVLRVLAIFAFSSSGVANAERLVFHAPSGLYPNTPSLYWPAINGFLMGPSWSSNDGRDLTNAPYIGGNIGNLTSAAGAFTFNSIELGGWPWDNFGMHRPDADNPVPIVFYGATGSPLAIRAVSLTGDNTFVRFSERIEGVHSMLIGSMDMTTINVRLRAITINEPAADGSVPEPTVPTLLICCGLAALLCGRLGAHRRGPRAKLPDIMESEQPELR